MLFFGFLFQRFKLSQLGSDITYLDFLLPGVCSMTVLFGASQSGISLIRDIQTGLYDRMRQTPAPVWALLGGKICADTSRLLLQAIIVATIGVIIGAQLNVRFGELLIAICALSVFALFYASFSCWVAIKTRSQEHMAVLVHLINLPVFFTSTALVPSRQMPGWLAQISNYNPLSLVVDLLRSALI